MQTNILNDNLLALHYVQPMSVNRLLPLLKEDPELTSITTMPATKLALLLKMNNDKAQLLQSNFRRVIDKNLSRYYEALKIMPLFFYDDLYPKQLLEIYDPPTVLYLRGEQKLLTYANKLAIVGSRKATSYSEKCLALLLPALIKRQYVIVSGLAKGVDGLAHAMTMERSGRTIAVLGHGFNYSYPSENKNLAQRMMKEQLVMTEYPPYMKPQKWHFPMRNRIISGLSAGVVVTEAGEKSGTMSTVDYALDHGRPIFALPGDIGSSLSVGPHKLITEGAKLIWNSTHILEEIETNE
ncbi:DNA-processing protein DprA [Kurthia sibirica]|uniref:DNA-protecting protein DprA n=1 Tax=Kurthia sibirica TaxID=202750 RepID=A0A2U3AQT7_9BACL|nr:DNA-processing protein DprA [Kurthia sibirica]PWI26884.1 DNA-protecting protein DprA [Kurthia sibirica]GEK32577.1 DNA processing protein DprA [Kurthia sibirica]